jgi:hypothetical protein
LAVFGNLNCFEISFKPLSFIPKKDAARKRREEAISEEKKGKRRKETQPYPLQPT